MQECRDKTKFNVNPLSSPTGGLFEGAGAIISVPHEKLEYEVKSSSIRRLGHAAEYHNQIRNCWLVNKPSRISLFRHDLQKINDCALSGAFIKNCSTVFFIFDVLHLS